MEDPLSSVHDRPHRYLLDSDSEDEEGQGIYSPSTSGPSRLSKLHITSPAPAQVSISSTGPFEEVILGIGQAGRYICKKSGTDGKIMVKVGEEVVGIGGVIGERLILGINDEQVENLHSLSTSLNNLQAKSWIIVSTYLPSMYIPDQPFSLPTAPIRCLSIENGVSVKRELKGVEPITSPNYVTGLAAALLSKLIHPSTPSTPATLLLLPLPISSIPDQSLLNAFSQISTSKIEIKLSRAGVWSEDEDEPFQQAGMGGAKHVKPDLKREIDGMYM